MDYLETLAKTIALIRGSPDFIEFEKSEEKRRKREYWQGFEISFEKFKKLENPPEEVEEIILPPVQVFNRWMTLNQDETRRILILFLGKNKNGRPRKEPKELKERKKQDNICRHADITEHFLKGCRALSFPRARNPTAPNNVLLKKT